MKQIWLFNYLFLCLLCILIRLNDGEITGEKICGNKQCSVPISKAKTLLKYVSPDKDRISFDAGAIVDVLSKTDNFWFIKHKDKEGLAPAKFLKELKVLVGKADLLKIPHQSSGTEPSSDGSIFSDIGVTDRAPTLKASVASPPIVSAEEPQEQLGSVSSPIQQFEVVDGTTLYVDPVPTLSEIQPSIASVLPNNEEKLTDAPENQSDVLKRPSVLPKKDSVLKEKTAKESSGGSLSDYEHSVRSLDSTVNTASESTPPVSDQPSTEPSLAQEGVNNAVPELIVQTDDTKDTVVDASSIIEAISEGTSSGEPQISEVESEESDTAQQEDGVLKSIWNSVFSSGDGSKENSEENETEREDETEDDNEEEEEEEDDQRGIADESVVEQSKQGEVPTDMLNSESLNGLTTSTPVVNTGSSAQSTEAPINSTGAADFVDSGQLKFLPTPTPLDVTPPNDEASINSTVASDFVDSGQIKFLPTPTPLDVTPPNDEVLSTTRSLPPGQLQEKARISRQVKVVRKVGDQEKKTNEQDFQPNNEQNQESLEVENLFQSPEVEHLNTGKQINRETMLEHDQPGVESLHDHSSSDLLGLLELEEQEQKQEAVRHRDGFMIFSHQEISKQTEEQVVNSISEQPLHLPLGEIPIPTEQHIEHPAEQIADEPMQQVTENPMEEYSEQSLEQPPGQPIEQFSEQTMEQLPGQSVEQLPEQAMEQLPEQSVELLPEKPVEQLPEQPVEQPSESEVGKVSQEPAVDGMFSWFSALFVGNENSVPLEEPEYQSDQPAVPPSTDFSHSSHLHEHSHAWGSVEQDVCLPESDCTAEKTNTFEHHKKVGEHWFAFGLETLSLDALLLRLVATAATLLLGVLAFYFVQKKHVNSRLVARINELEKQLLVVSKEALILSEEASAASLLMDSTEMDSLREELEFSQAARVDLEEQVATLERELEEATETGIELNRLLAETLEASKGKAHVGLIASVERLQQQLDGQKGKVDSLTQSLASTCAENDSLRVALSESQEKISALEAELGAVVDIAANLRRGHEEAELQAAQKVTDVQSQLEAALSSKVLQESRLASELSALKLNHEKLRAALATRDAEVYALQDTVKELETGGERANQLLDFARLRAELEQSKADRDELLAKLHAEETTRVRVEDHANLIKEDISKLRLSIEEALKEKLEAETRLTVLSNYFKEKEAQLQKELGLQEAIVAQHRGDESTVIKHLQSLQEEVDAYRAQNESLKNEIVNQERDFKGQIAALEKKAHDNWVSARQAERRLEESRQEAAQLRHRLTIVEKNNTDQSNRLESNGEGGIGSPVMMVPLPPLGDMETPPPLPPFMFSPPPYPPPFMPPPPPPHPMGRPPPLGRMSSPPPPIGQFSPPPPPYDRLDRSPSPPPHRYHHRSPPPPQQWEESRPSFRSVPKPSPKKLHEQHDHKGSALSSGHSNESLERSRHSDHSREQV